MKKLANILILAGGDSTRFWPLENKIITPFLGKQLLERIIRQVKQFAEKIIVVVSNSLNLESLPQEKNIIYLVQKNLTAGMASAIYEAKDLIRDEEVLIINGSDWINFSFIEKIIQVKDQVEILFSGLKIKSYKPGGYFQFDKSKKLKAIVEKPDPKKLPSNLFKIVIDYYKKGNYITEQIEKLIKKNPNDDLYEKSLTYLINQKYNFSILTYNDIFFPLKFSWQILPLMNYFLNSIRDFKEKIKIEISSEAVISGTVLFGKNVKVGDFAKIVGPTYIGDNTFIGDHTLIVKSHIGNNCLIGGYSEVTRSYIANHVMLHRNYVGDSVIDSNVMLGAGASLANYRFDEKKIKDTDFNKLGAIIGKKTKIGVNCTCLPGIKIGKNCFIGPGQIVCEDIPDGKFFFKNQLKDNLIK